MNPEKLTGKQMDMYERVWTRFVLVSGAMLITGLLAGYFFWNDQPIMLACAAGAAASLVLLAIAVIKLHELDRGLRGSDRKERGEMHSALDQLDD